MFVKIFVYAELKQSIVDKAVDQLQPRLRVCTQANEQHFKQLCFFMLNYSHQFWLHGSMEQNQVWSSFLCCWSQSLVQLARVCQCRKHFWQFYVQIEDAFFKHFI